MARESVPPPDRSLREILREIRSDATTVRYVASVMSRIEIPGFIVVPSWVERDRTPRP